MDAVLTSHLQSRRLGLTPDDSSSATSRSSANNAMKCRRCGEPESLPSKPLIKCPSCHKKRWHAYCHNPPVDARNVPEDWKCKSCIKSSNAASDPSLPFVLSDGPSVPHPPPESSININAGLCKEPGCNKPVFQTAAQFCKLHSIQQQYKNATSKRSGELVVAPGYKPIKKKKLYNFKLDDDTKQLLKRKRPIPANGSISDPRVTAIVSNASIQPQKLQQQGPRPPSIPDHALVTKPLVHRMPEERRRQFNIRAEMGSQRSPIDENYNLSMGSASMAEPPIGLMNAELEGGDLIIPSMPNYPHTPHSTGQPVSASPQYSPPPPVAVSPEDISRLWLDQDDNPGSQINHELRARVDPDLSSATDHMEVEQSPLLAILTTIQERTSSGESLQRDLATGDVLAADEDIEMPDQPTTTIVHEPLENDIPPQHSLSQALISMSSTTTPVEDIILGANVTATFDDTELDSFLAKQSELGSDFQPTPQELATTQIWGHIDPRDVWQKEGSAEWLLEKRREIDARGGRKANYGKILTPQVRKERADKGWHVHQNSDAVPPEIMAETATHMEELFGIKGIDDMIPCLQSGQLAMSEKQFDESGRKKRKGTVKVHLVT